MDVDISYDPEADAAYLAFVADQSDSQVHSIIPPLKNGEIILDFNSEGKLIGLEVLGAKAVLSDSLLATARSLSTEFKDR